jgi:hypothetical protein
MMIDQTTAGGKTHNAEESNFPTGIYTCKLSDVVEIGPRADDERQTPRLVFEFTVDDGPYQGKKTSTFVRKNLFAGGGSRNSKPSNLYKLAKSLGCADPMAGFDTTHFVGKLYTVVVKNEGDRAWPESIIPATGTLAGAIAGAVQEQKVPGQRANGPPPRKPAAAPAVDAGGAKYWLDRGDGTDKLADADEVRGVIMASKTGKAADVQLCKDGDDQWKPATEYGFEDSPI